MPVPENEPIAGDLSITYLYPAYTNLPARVEEGTPGDLKAPKGTEIRMSARADRDLVQAFAVIDGNAVQLEVSGPGNRLLAGSFKLEKRGHWRFRFADKKGRAVAEGPDRAIEIIPDQPPTASISDPTKSEVEVDPLGKLPVVWSALDDYGLGKVDLDLAAAGRSGRAHRIGRARARSGRAPFVGNLRLGDGAARIARRGQGQLPRRGARSGRDRRPAARNFRDPHADRLLRFGASQGGGRARAGALGAAGGAARRSAGGEAGPARQHGCRMPQSRRQRSRERQAPGLHEADWYSELQGPRWRARSSWSARCERPAPSWRRTSWRRVRSAARSNMSRRACRRWCSGR